MERAVTVGASNVVLYCARWRETVEFHRDVLGLPVRFENDWFVEFDVGDDGGTAISIADARRATIPSVDGAGITITWRVADVAATRAELTSRGVAVSELRLRLGGTVCYFHDPEGHRFEIWTPAAEA